MRPSQSPIPTTPLGQPAVIASSRGWRELFSRPEALYVALALSAFLVFLPVRHNGFVNIDDEVYVTENPHVRTGLRFDNVLWAFGTGHASNWHPLTWLSHMLDCQLFGQDAGKHHLVSLALHVGNTLLLFSVLHRLTGSRYRSFVVATLFALHPLRVESVAWVAERKDVLSGLFFFLSLGSYARYAQTVRLQDMPSPGEPPIRPKPASASFAWNSSFLLALAFYALGLMSKPMLVTTPFLFLLLDYWPLKRAKLDFPHGAWRRWFPLILEKVPFLMLSVISCTITLTVQKSGGAVQTLPVSARLGNALVAYSKYLGKIFWPQNLAVLYPHPGQWPLAVVAGSGIFLLAISAAVLAFARKQPCLAVGWFWFIGALVPAIGFVQVGLQAMADRYTYLPSVGLFIALVWGIGALAQRFALRKELLAGLTGVVLAALSIVTIRQLPYWRNGETLLGRALQVTGNNYLLLNNLAATMSGSNAIQNLEAALKLNPASGDAHNNLGVEFAMRGDLPGAIEHFRAAITAQPRLASAHSNLGMALAQQHKWAEAISEYRESLRLSPDDARVHSNLGNALDEQEQPAEAVAHYQQALQLAPENAEIHINLALTLAKLGRQSEAMAHYAAALRLEPGNKQAQQEMQKLGQTNP
jgi:tetratricopeptide (TPR) repeat protein